MAEWSCTRSKKDLNLHLTFAHLTNSNQVEVHCSSLDKREAMIFSLVQDLELHSLLLLVWCDTHMSKLFYKEGEPYGSIQ